MKVDLRKLRTFCLIVDKGSFRRAADWLQISQPSVSQHVAILEREFGVKLFHRNGRNIDLTSEGHALYTLGKELVKLGDSIPVTFHEMKTLGRGSLVIGASHHIAENLLPEILDAFGRKFPELHVSVKTGNPSYLHDLLKERCIELAIMGAAPGMYDGMDLVVRSLASEKLTLVVPQGHAREKRIVRPSDLRHTQLVRYVRDHPLALTLEDFFLRHQLEITSQFEVDSVQLAMSLVAAGNCWAIVEQRAVGHSLKKYGVQVAHLENLEKISWEIQVMYPQWLGLSFAGWEMVRYLEQGLCLSGRCEL